MERTILHVDFNNFYASVEQLFHPELRGKPMIVTGNPDERHGIVLSKNNEAKALGIKTAETIGEARAKCPTVLAVTGDMAAYSEFADGLLELCMSYTDRIESGGEDEAYLDVTGSPVKDGVTIANEIRRRSVEEYGITCSVGVSFTKTYAKLGSDLKKPNATTVISPQNYKEVAWRLPASELFGVGQPMQLRLYRYGILTIGDIAQSERSMMGVILGKTGDHLWLAANGLDRAPVAHIEDAAPIKSVGHSKTTLYDLTNEEEVAVTLLTLAENIAMRLRKHGFKGGVVHIGARGKDLRWLDRQMTLTRPTQITDDIFAAGMALFRRHWRWEQPIRSLGLRCTGLVDVKHNVQLSFFDEKEQDRRDLRREQVIDDIRRRFGASSILRGGAMTKPELTGYSFKEDRRLAVYKPAGMR